MEQLVALREAIDGIAMYLVCARASFLRLEQSLVDVANIGCVLIFVWISVITCINPLIPLYWYWY
jgi:hypothetical protein